MNAKQELMEVAEKNNLEILKIDCQNYDPDDEYFYYGDSYEKFTSLDELDFDYDDDMGCQYLFGGVYCIDKATHEPVWLTRGEYDGAEWWKVNRIPKFYLANMSFDEILEANKDVLKRLKEK